MPKKKKKRLLDYQAARQAEFSVIACTAEVVGGSFGGILFATPLIAIGIGAFVKGHWILAIPFLLFGLGYPLEMIRAWKLAGRPVLSFKKGGLRYHDQFFPWDEIERVEIMDHGHRGPDSAWLVLRSGKREFIEHDYLEISMEEVASEIKKRLNPKA